MSDSSIYNSREKFIPKSDRSIKNPKQRREGLDDQIRKRRSNNRGFRRVIHLAKRESGRKFLIITVVVTLLLFLIFTWFYSY